MQPDSCNLLYRYLTVMSSAPRCPAIAPSDNFTLGLEGETALSEIKERKYFQVELIHAGFHSYCGFIGNSCCIYLSLTFCLICLGKSSSTAAPLGRA